MPIVFAAITPHSPLLHHRIGAQHRAKLNNTIAAYAEVERSLYAAHAETIVVITPHGAVAPDAFTIDIAEQYVGGLQQFGDFSPPSHWPVDAALIQSLRAADETNRHAPPLMLVHQPTLDYGTVVALSMLTRHIPTLAVVPLHISGLAVVQHWRFGQFLGDQLRATSRRVACIASADLSHRLTNDAPSGWSPAGPAFDRQLLELIRRGDAAGIAKLPSEQVAAAMPCGYLPMVTLLGLLDGIHWVARVLSYEGPFGVGHLVAELDVA